MLPGDDCLPLSIGEVLITSRLWRDAVVHEDNIDTTFSQATSVLPPSPPGWSLHVHHYRSPIDTLLIICRGWRGHHLCHW